MYEHRTTYRGYTICLSGEDSTWSSRVEPVTPDFPILPQPVSDNHRSWGRAFFAAKREIDRILAG
jgi:hypothetical protein